LDTKIPENNFSLSFRGLVMLGITEEINLGLLIKTKKSKINKYFSTIQKKEINDYSRLLKKLYLKYLEKATEESYERDVLEEDYSFSKRVFANQLVTFFKLFADDVYSKINDSRGIRL
jgi:hypothetical protein